MTEEQLREDYLVAALRGQRLVRVPRTSLPGDSGLMDEITARDWYPNLRPETFEQYCERRTQTEHL